MKSLTNIYASALFCLLVAACLSTDDNEGDPGQTWDTNGERDAGDHSDVAHDGLADEGTGVPDGGTTPDSASDAPWDQSSDPNVDLPAELGPDPGQTDPVEEPMDELWLEWGTRGTTSSTPRSDEGYGFCGLPDIRTDDLNDEYDSSVPEGDWGTRPVEDDPGRCGDDFDTEMWRLANCERITSDLNPLRCDLRLVWLGRVHSQDMIRRSYFDHVNPDGEDPFDRMEAIGINFSWAGENIAMYPDLEDAHLGWMDSEGHRENILESHFTHSGVGIIRSGSYYWLTQEFIAP